MQMNRLGNFRGQREIDGSLRAVPVQTVDGDPAPSANAAQDALCQCRRQGRKQHDLAGRRLAQHAVDNVRRRARCVHVEDVMLRVVGGGKAAVVFVFPDHLL